MIRLLFLFAPVIFPFLLLAQNNPSCGSDAYRQAVFQQHPEAAAAWQQVETQLYETLFNQPTLAAKPTDGPLVLPLVFHIIHNNGPENIPDDRIYAAVEHLNLAFAHSGFYAGQGPGTDVGIQFCLAQRAPDGSATTGITRTQSTLTDVLVDVYDDTLKNLVRWDPEHYINVWVVKSILSHAPPNATAYGGYATLPWAAGGNRDGIVVTAISTGQPFPNVNNVMPHEVGHYLGLYHTFENGCPNDDCLLNGDRVCDTPPDQGTFTACGFNSWHTDANAPAPNPFTTDVPDATDNFMDYTACPNRMTDGQAERMRTVVQTTRKSLLESVACIQACPSGTLAVLSPTEFVQMKAGDTLHLQNLSVYATHYTWYVDDVPVSTDSLFSFVAGPLGLHRIKLEATGDTPNCISVDVVAVQVSCNIEGFIETITDYGTPGVAGQFKAQTPQATQYQWYVNGNAVGSGATLSYTFTQPGSYLLQLTAANAYCSYSVQRNYNVPPYCAPALPPQLTYRGFSCEPEITAMEPYPNGDQLCGGSNCGNAMLFKMHPDGSIAWAKNIGVKFESKVAKISVLSDYTALISGWADNKPYVLKIDSSGAVLWKKQKQSYTYVESMATAPDGSFWLLTLDTGAIRNMQYYNAQGDLLWQRQDTLAIYLKGLYPCAIGGLYAIYGHTGIDYQFVIVRMDNNGDAVWAKKFKQATASQYLSGMSLAPEPDGGFSCMVVDAAHQPILSRYDANGNLLWSSGYIGFGSLFNSQSFVFFKKTADQGYIWSGYYGNFINNNGVDHQYFCKVDSVGNVKWSAYIDAFDGVNILSSTVPSNTCSSWADHTIIPMYNKTFDYVYMARSNANGLAGACSVKTFLASKSPATLTQFPTTTVLMPATTTSEVLLPFDTLNPDFVPLYWYPECGQFPICTENCANGVDDDGDGFVDCFDPQCTCYETPACTTSVAPPIRARLAWETPVNEVNVLGVPVIGNLNPDADAMPEILVQTVYNGSFSSYNRLDVFAGDGSNKNGQDKSSYNSYLNNYPAVPAIADFNRDGTPEISVKYISGSNYILGRYHPHATNPLLPSSSTLTFYTNNKSTHNSIADFDKDGKPESYIGNLIISTYPLSNTDIVYQQVVVRADTTKPQGRLAYRNFLYPSTNPVAAELLTRNQCSGDAECDNLELAAGPVIYSVDLTAWDNDPGGLTVRKDLNVLDPTSAIFSDGYTTVADLNLDNTPEIIVAGKRDNVYGIYAWNRNGLVKWFPYPQNTAFSGALPCVADVFDERTIGYQYNYPEIIAASANRLTCFNLNIAATSPGTPYWWSIPTNDTLGLMAATAFDFNADGVSEIVYQDATHLRVLYGGAQPFPTGVDDARNWFAFPAPTLSGDHYPVVADCDNDGEAEIIFTSYPAGGPDSIGSQRGRLRVLEAQPPSSWAGARPLWNQFGYAPAQIGDNLSVPVNPQTLLVYGGGQWPNNRYLGQLPTMDQSLKAVLTAPDATVSVDSITCADAEIEVYLRVCNNGLRALPDSTPVQFYLFNPTIFNAPTWAPAQYLQGPVLPGACTVQVFKAPAANGIPLFAVLNDDGSKPRPYSLAGGYEPALARECDYTDNMVSTAFAWDNPVLDLGPDLTACSANATVLDAGPGFARYRWNDGSNGRQFTAFGPGTYSVKVWDDCDFEQTDTVNITISADGTLDLGPDRTICPGDTVHLSAPGYEAVAWSPVAVVSCASRPNTIAAPATTVVLTATGSNADCLASDTVRIQVLPLPAVQFSTTGATAGNTDGSATATPVFGVQPFVYQWSTQPPQSSETATGLAAGTYSLTLTDAAGCTAVQSVEVPLIVGASGPAAALLQLAVTPNPAAGHFTVRGVWGRVVNGACFITDAAGKELFWESFTTDRLELTVDCTHWPTGQYTVQVQLNNGQQVGLKVMVAE